MTIDWTDPKYHGPECFWCHKPTANDAAWDADDDCGDGTYPGSKALCWIGNGDVCPEMPTTAKEAYDRGRADGLDDVVAWLRGTDSAACLEAADAIERGAATGAARRTR